jgi:hypothetical protein
VGHYSKDCPKLKLGNGASKVIALTSNLAQGECNRLIFLKGKLSKREVLCFLDTGASHNFITQESAERMGLPLEELEAPIEVHFADGIPHPTKFQAKDSLIGELERQGGFVGFQLGWNGLHFGNGVHHPKQCAHRRAQ